MAALKKLPHPLIIIMAIAVLAALATWLVPAGRFDTLKYADKKFSIQKDNTDIAVPFTQKTLDSLHISTPLAVFAQGSIRKPVAIPDTYHRLPPNKQGFVDTMKAPIQGVYNTVDIMLFLLLIGSFISVFNATGAMEKGLVQLAAKMKGRESWLIVITSFLLMLGGASYGMGEEAIAFYPILVPLFTAAGYDLIIPLAIIFGAPQLGTLASVSNPFSTIIASNICGINWTDGLNSRMLMFVLSGILFVGYLLRYAQKVKRNPTASLVYRNQGVVESPFPVFSVHEGIIGKLGSKNILLLIIFFLTFVLMVAGVVAWNWWMPEMSAVFLTSAILVGIIGRIGQKLWMEQFLHGAQSLLGVTLIIGAARGITILLNSGNISDSIIYYTSQSISGLPPWAFITLLLLLYMLFSFFISSSSGMAVLTMPIISALATAAHVPDREVVNSYLFGMGITYFIAPTALILPSLAMVNVSLKTWWQFIWPFLLMMVVLCTLFLIVGIQF